MSSQATSSAKQLAGVASRLARLNLNVRRPQLNKTTQWRTLRAHIVSQTSWAKRQESARCGHSGNSAAQSKNGIVRQTSREVRAQTAVSHSIKTRSTMVPGVSPPTRLDAMNDDEWQKIQPSALLRPVIDIFNNTFKQTAAAVDTQTPSNCPTAQDLGKKQRILCFHGGQTSLNGRAEHIHTVLLKAIHLMVDRPIHAH